MISSTIRTMDLRNAIDIHAPHALDTLSPEQLDQLPVGAIRVDGEGRILFYSRSQGRIVNREPAAVIGRNFFTEVAPCTVVPEFYGRFRKGVLTGELSTTFEFVFDFEMQPVQVRISMRAAECPDEFWIIVEPLRLLPPRDDQAARALIAGKFDAPTASLSASGLSAVSFDFSKCDQEPIATCGMAQPFGCLLVLDPQTLRIEACSANAAMYLGPEAETLLGTPLGQSLRPADMADLRELLCPTTLDAAYCPPLFQAVTMAGGLPLDCRQHRWRGRLLLELEPHGEMAMDIRMSRFDFMAYQRRLESTQDLLGLCQRAVEQMRELTGVERVLMYRFEPDQDGIVIAESVLEGAWTPVRGLRYPATDIPRQARALYLETPIRYAPSRDHPDIPLLSRTLSPAAIDIGMAQLRALSPIHRDYLQRFGVNGSMSLSIVYDDRLWGLVIFHNRTPHPVTAYVRQRLVEMVASLSSRLALLDEREGNRAREEGMAAVNRIVGAINVEQPFPESFAGKDALLRELVDADAVQLYHRGRPLFPGQDFELAAGEIEALLVFLKTRPGPLWSTDCLSGEYEPAAAYPERLAGVMVIFLDERREDILLFGRRRVRYTVRWGADPSSLPFAGTTDQTPLGWPNRVFQVWQEERTHHARPWSGVATGLALKHLIQNVIVASAAHFEQLSLTLAYQRDQLHQSREEMRHRAMHDALTGLPNRVRFREALGEAITASRQDGCWFAVGLLDIDHFKTINDTLGHDRGDALLCGVAGRLTAALPAGGLLARLGGDEFALLLRQSETGFLELANQLIERLRQPIQVGEDRFTITGSLGLAIATGDAAEPGELLKQADLALYRAKEEGRNCARPFDSHLETLVLQRLEIDRAVLGQTPMDAIEILLQPQVAIASPSTERRFEVLARWRREDGTLLMPGDFIPAAERNGVISAVTGTVLRRSIELLRTTLARGGPAMRLAINLSAADLGVQTFAYRLIEDLHAADVPPNLLEIEITESILLRMTPSVKASLHTLVGAGVRLSLDDFGTGFSSMVYLRELPVTSLKIDRTFIRNLEVPCEHSLVAGMIAMAHSIGKEVVAEGIETPAQLELLTKLGCDWGQGYLWSRPLPPDEALMLPF
jgi:photoactive yellow protein